MTLCTNFLWGFSGEPQEMLVENGRVLARGVLGSSAPEGSQTVDLGGRYLLPAFTDCHCHILPTGLDLQKLNLGSCSNHAEVLDAVRDWERTLPKRDWLLAVHYDQTKYENGQHLSRDRLDAISKTRPMILRHVSGHASVANSAALKAAGVNDKTPDPEGGEFVRDESGGLTGVLLEHAHETVTAAAPAPPIEKMAEAILLAGQKMADLGIACASDMMTGRFGIDKELRAYRMAVEAGCPIKLRLYAVWSAVFGPKGIGVDELSAGLSGVDPLVLRIAGIKIFADGAIGAGTAAIYGNYAPDSTHANPKSKIQNPKSGTSGQLMYSPERLSEMVQTADQEGFRISIHSIGDHSTDLVMDALEASQDPKRHRIEHAMILGDAQIERLAGLGVHVSMQPEFLIRFAHAYRRQFGEEKAARLKRFRSVKDARIPLSLSSDRPIVSGDPWDGILTASNRPEGFDPTENLSRNEAIRAYTQLAAAANDDQRDMGRLEPGQMAEFTLYDEDPLTADRPRPSRDFRPTTQAAI